MTSSNIIKEIHDKPTANIIFNKEKQKTFSKIMDKTGIPTLQLLFCIVLQVLTGTIRQEKEIKGI